MRWSQPGRGGAGPAHAHVYRIARGKFNKCVMRGMRVTILLNAALGKHLSVWLALPQPGRPHTVWTTHCEKAAVVFSCN